MTALTPYAFAVLLVVAFLMGCLVHWGVALWLDNRSRERMAASRIRPRLDVTVADAARVVGVRAERRESGMFVVGGKRGSA